MTEQERRESYEYARANLSTVPDPRKNNNWELFTADPADRNAMVYSIARPGHGAESSYFGTLADTAKTFEHLASLYDQDARYSDSSAHYYDSNDWPEKAAKDRDRARDYRELATEYREHAARIRAQWAR